MKARGSGTPGRAATARVSRVLTAAEKKAREKAAEVNKAAKTIENINENKRGAHAPPPAGSGSSVSVSELVRAVWHAFPGFLAVWLHCAFYADRPFRVWRARPVAFALLPFTAACWFVEWLRLTPRFRTTTSTKKNENKNKNNTHNLLGRALGVIDSLLRAGELRRVHGTAWYLLGVCISLLAYPSDVAVLSICHLAWWGPPSLSLFAIHRIYSRETFFYIIFDTRILSMLP